MRSGRRFQVFKLKHFIVWLIVKAVRPSSRSTRARGIQGGSNLLWLNYSMVFAAASGGYWAHHNKPEHGKKASWVERAREWKRESENKKVWEKQRERHRARQIIKVIQKENKMNLPSQKRTTMPMKNKWHEKNKKEEATNSGRQRERNIKIQWKLKTSEIKWFGANICACACDSFLFTANAFRLLCAHNSMGFYVYLPSLHYDFMLFSRQSTLLPLLCCRCCCCCCCSCLRCSCCCLFRWTWRCYSW